MKTTFRPARLPFLSHLMLAWHLRHHWQLKHAFPGCYWTVRWAGHHIMAAGRVCWTELMPALYLMCRLPLRVCQYWRALMTFVAKHTPRRHSHAVSNRGGDTDGRS